MTARPFPDFRIRHSHKPSGLTVRENPEKGRHGLIWADRIGIAAVVVAGAAVFALCLVVLIAMDGWPDARLWTAMAMWLVYAEFFGALPVWLVLRAVALVAAALRRPKPRGA